MNAITRTTSVAMFVTLGLAMTAWAAEPPPIEPSLTAAPPGKYLAAGEIDLKAELLERAKEIGQSRLNIGVHHPSDVAAGATLGEAIGAKIIASAVFQKDVAAARQEIESVLTKK